MSKKYKDMSPEEKKRHNQRTAAWAKRNPQKIKKISKRHYDKYPFDLNRHRLRRYGVTSEQFARMLADQGGCCAICGTTEHGARNWHLDHCHSTGVPRGILCVRCNGGLGQFKDNPVLLQSAIRYLQSGPLKG